MLRKISGIDILSKPQNGLAVQQNWYQYKLLTLTGAINLHFAPPNTNQQQTA